MRIVTLLPSATEIVYTLGLGEELVGVSHDCDYPPEVTEKHVLSGTEININMTSRQMDEITKGKIHNGLSVYHIDDELLKKLKPDLILTQELCEVCAPSYSEVKEAAKILAAAPKIASLEPECLGDILENIELVGQLTGREAQAKEIVAELQKRIERVAELGEKVEYRPRIFCMEWLSPIYCAGHWVPEMVGLAGGEDPVGKARKPSFEVEWEDVVRCEPEIMVLMPCGFYPERTFEEIDLVLELEGWSDLPAVKNDKVFVVNGSWYFNRPGPRIVTGLEILAQIIHPEIFLDIALPGSIIKLSDHHPSIAST